ncbi:MAG: hypothetical protein QM516_05895 [Limnohabitans sp.]|nr:hypothetical protein [Limnohabitans sp.]
MSDRSAFPTTHATWLETILIDDRGMSDTQRGDVASAAKDAHNAAKARLHVMERYAAPLEIFVKGSSLARLGEPAELVNGFFAARLSDANYLRAWPRSGMRFRRWLMNGMLFYGQGIARDRARAAARGATVSADELDLRTSASSDAEMDFERAWALTVVREATARVEAALLDEGRADEFEIFRRHAIDGQPYAAFAGEVGRTPQQCAGATRLVAQRVRAALAEVLREEGVPEAELDDEIARVRGVL